MSSMPELSAIPWAVRKQRNKRPHLPWAKSGKESGSESANNASGNTDSGNTKPQSPGNAQPEANAEAVATRKALGQSAERAARLKLESHGLVWVCSNFRCKVGEIDLIMRDGDQAVVVEVRTRTNARHGTALESIGHHKQRKISKAALYWWTTLGQRHFTGMRFDAVGMDPLSTDNSPNENTSASHMTWVKNAWMLD
ncbi:MAG: YraN family protein [Limnobacter sp.]|nr:YraN family protein [Limnobacter sp.]